MSADYTLTISKDGTVRVSTGETLTLKYPNGADGNPSLCRSARSVYESVALMHHSVVANHTMDPLRYASNHTTTLSPTPRR